MKTCPICKARCFDDMEVCYGCMHRFTEVEVQREPERVEIGMTASDTTVVTPSNTMVVDAPPVGRHAAPTPIVETGVMSKTGDPAFVASANALRPVASIPIGTAGPAAVDGRRYEVVISLQPVD